MITIIHGDNIEASRLELNRLKKEHQKEELRSLDGAGISELTLTQSTQSGSLFGNSHYLVIENMFSKNSRKLKFIDNLINIIKNCDPNLDVIIWEEKEVSASQLNKFGTKLISRIFKTPVIIFKFLDSLRPDNTRAMVLLYGQVVTSEAPELVHTMIIKRVRQMIMIKDKVIPEKMRDWQIQGLSVQANNFTMDKLRVMHKLLVDIEYSIKSGVSALPMKEQLELFLTKI